MDFLRIRNQARERAGGRPADAQATPSPGAAPAPPPAAPAAPVAVDAAEGALAERLERGPAPPSAPAPEAFATWRPGSGAPPPIPPAPPGRPSPAVNPGDFAVLRPGGAGPVPVQIAEALPPAPPPPAPADPFDGFFFDPAEPPPPGELGESPPVAEPRRPEAVAREEYLTFMLGAEEYAVAIERVREVLKCPPVTEVPRAPAHVLGVVTVRGEVVPVFEPRRRLGLPSTPPVEGAGRVVIVDAGEGPCGLLVDAVASVVRLRPGSIEPCPQGIGGQSQEYLAGIGRDGDRLFTVLDLGALLRRPLAAAGRRPAEGRAHGP